MHLLRTSEQREIRQLWDSAITYWVLAKDIVKEITEEKKQLTCDEVSKYYEIAIPTDPTERCLNLILAHLSSAAIRLFTIEERLKEARIFPDYLKIYKEVSSAHYLSWLNSNFDDFVHQILRDNAAHIENDDKNEQKKLLYLARLKVIREKSIQKMYDPFDRVMRKFELELKIRGIISTPPA